MELTFERYRHRARQPGAIATAAVPCVAIVLPSQGEQSQVAIRARAMVDDSRGFLVEHASVLVRGERIVTAGPAPTYEYRIRGPCNT